MKTKLVIFGITGDLSRHKLLPALEQVISTGDFDDLSIIGVSRHEVDLTELLGDMDDLRRHTNIFEMDLTKVEDYEGLKDYLALSSSEQVLMYLAVPPGAAAQIVDLLAEAGLNTPNIKLLFEKPFGFNLTTAQDLIDHIAASYAEEQVYRIDHYMAKEVAAEVIQLRIDAKEERHSWNKQSIESIDIVALEALDVQHRANFYEQTGALRDVVQGHLLQLLSLVLMDIPDDFVMANLPIYRLAALQHIEPVDPAKTIRAQYEGYQAEVENPGSTTETFVSVQLESGDENWHGVPIRLTTGKALSEKKTAITINFKDGAEAVFEEDVMPTNELPGAYERVLIDAINGRKSIFTTSPEILRAWEILAPLQKEWSMSKDTLTTYKKGSELKDIIA
jgi:glucose-6-phosphate 1-dehydrogenase